MSQIIRTILVVFITAIVVGGGVYLWQSSQMSTSSPINTQKEKPSKPEITPEIITPNKCEEILKYNCELSGGSFSDNNCECPIEEEVGQTQALMYDKSTGYCQATEGGPARDAFAVSVGLPWGSYSFWTDIIGNNCKKTGGVWLNAQCTCRDQMIYDKSTGSCE